MVAEAQHPVEPVELPGPASKKSFSTLGDCAELVPSKLEKRIGSPSFMLDGTETKPTGEKKILRDVAGPLGVAVLTMATCVTCTAKPN